MKSAINFFLPYPVLYMFLLYIGVEKDTAAEIVKWFFFVVVGLFVTFFCIKVWKGVSSIWTYGLFGQRKPNDPGVILSNRAYHSDAPGGILSNRVYRPNGSDSAGNANFHMSFGQRDSVESMTGAEFEQYVASTLRSHGWSAEVTKTGADQGLDVLARKGALVVAIQCKRYAQAVSNGAIQEVHAARSFYDANRACVITTSRFTRSAHDLATKLDVKLLHYDDLDALDRYVT